MTSACIARSSRNSCRSHREIGCGDQWQDHGLVFASGFGTPVDPAQHPADNSGRGAESGMSDIGVHTLRDSAAVAWLETGSTHQGHG